MTRASRTARLAAVALVAALGLSGCSEEGPGAGVAVQVGDEQVSASDLVDLTDEVVRDEPVPPAALAELQRGIVALLVQERVYEEVAREVGVEVEQGEVDAELAAVEESGGDIAEQLRGQGVPPSFLQSYARLVLLQQALLEEVGSEAELRDLLVATAGDLDVSVSPRLGEWTPDALAVTPVPPSLSTPEGGNAPADGATAPTG